MVSRAGLKTWFDYELLFVGLAIALAGGFWVYRRVAVALRDASLPLESTQFALAIAAAYVLAVAGMLVLVSRFSG